MSPMMLFDAVREATPGGKWKARWDRSWPEYEAWFRARDGDDGPSRANCERAIARYMPELAHLHTCLTTLSGSTDRAARFLSCWCPPAYLGGCTLAAHARDGDVRLVRNYDLSPDLNEGLLLRTDWLRPVMGMVEFLWGLSDGINGAGLAVALAYGGRSEVRTGFGITLILRYLLETCETVTEALETLRRVPSHMAYNLVLADADGAVASVELMPGGGVRLMPRAAAANHQSGHDPADRTWFARTLKRHAFVDRLLAADPRPTELAQAFLQPPLHQADYTAGFGTLFTADYDPMRRSLCLSWPNTRWEQSLEGFQEGRRVVDLGPATYAPPAADKVDWQGSVTTAAKWIRFGMVVARRYGYEIDSAVVFDANWKSCS